MTIIIEVGGIAGIMVIMIVAGFVNGGVLVIIMKRIFGVMIRDSDESYS